MTSFDRSYSSDLCSIVTMALSRTVIKIFDFEKCCNLETRVRGHSESSKLVPFDSLHMITYSHSVVTLALACTASEI